MASFPQLSPLKPCIHLSSPIRVTCPAHLSSLDLITRIIFGEEYRAQSSLLCTLTPHTIHNNTRQNSAISRNAVRKGKEPGMYKFSKNLGATSLRTNIRHRRINFCRHGDLASGICAPPKKKKKVSCKMASSRDSNIKDRLKSHKREQHSKLVHSRHLAYPDYSSET